MNITKIIDVSRRATLMGAAGLFGALLLSCGGELGALGNTGGGGGGGAAGGLGEAGGSCSSDFGDNRDAKTLETFLNATATFSDTASTIEHDLVQTCQAMGQELGMTGTAPNDVRGACEPVAGKIREEMQALRSARLRAEVSIQPPVCEVSIEAYAECAGGCDAHIDPGHAEIQCEGGELRGGCSGECTGHCSAEVHGECAASCEGTCSGGCTGTCEGQCDGRCSSTGPNGECRGRCSGTCHGTCSAGCRGSCEGQCVAEAHATCEGECRGSCSVEFTEPRCTGTVRPPSMSAECKASCDAKLDAQAHCTPGTVFLNVRGSVGDNEERVARLRQAIQSGMPQITSLRAKLERLAHSGRVIVEVGQHVPQALGNMGLRATRCATEAVASLPRAMGSVSVSVEVSVSVSASASASAG